MKIYRLIPVSVNVFLVTLSIVFFFIKILKKSAFVIYFVLDTISTGLTKTEIIYLAPSDYFICLWKQFPSSIKLIIRSNFQVKKYLTSKKQNCTFTWTMPLNCQLSQITKVDLCFDCDWLRKARRVVSCGIADAPSVIICSELQAFSK